MKLLFASDSFKGTISSGRTIELLTKAAKEVFGPCECEGICVADGGEGTTEAVISAGGGERIPVTVCNPLMEPVTAYYGKLDGNRAVLEMAAASGLPLVPTKLRNPLHTTTYGTGEMLKHALDQGFTDLSLAIGGSATNDGGMGCMRALGAKFLDLNGGELEGRGSDLEKVADIDLSGLHPRLCQVRLTVMCDVSNPLCGPEGATYTFGKQKGAGAEELKRLEAGMKNYREVLFRQFGTDPDQIPGSGAAGGLGAALLILAGGTLKSGIEAILDLIDFDSHLDGVSLVVTGEGRTDWQSCFGKVMQGVGMRCKKKGISAVALSGGMGEGAEGIFEFGVDSILTTINGAMDIEEALERAEELYYGGAVRMFRLIRTGMGL